MCKALFQALSRSSIIWSLEEPCEVGSSPSYRQRWGTEDLADWPKVTQLGRGGAQPQAVWLQSLCSDPLLYAASVGRFPASGRDPCECGWFTALLGRLGFSQLSISCSAPCNTHCWPDPGVLIQWGWAETWEGPFLTTSQVMLLLLLWALRTMGIEQKLGSSSPTSSVGWAVIASRLFSAWPCLPRAHLLPVFALITPASLAIFLTLYRSYGCWLSIQPKAQSRRTLCLEGFHTWRLTLCGCCLEICNHLSFNLCSLGEV